MIASQGEDCFSSLQGRFSLAARYHSTCAEVYEVEIVDHEKVYTIHILVHYVPWFLALGVSGGSKTMTQVIKFVM